MSIFLVPIKFGRYSVECLQWYAIRNIRSYSGGDTKEINIKKKSFVRQIRAKMKNKTDVHVESIERWRRNSSIKMHAYVAVGSITTAFDLEFCIRNSIIRSR